jgi:hypothetical protein
VIQRRFMSDLAEKDWVIVLRDGKKLAGFSTIQVIRLRVCGRARIFLFSGDTIVDRDYWRNPALAGSFGHFMLRMLSEHRGTPVYWFLISKGYRTYRFLPVFFNRFYPTCLRRTPENYQRLLDSVARHKFGHAYDADSGLIRVAGKKDWLRSSFGQVPSSRQHDPHVAFFLERNPEHARGDELACVTPVSKANLNRFARRVIQHTFVLWEE